MKNNNVDKDKLRESFVRLSAVYFRYYERFMDQI